MMEDSQKVARSQWNELSDPLLMIIFKKLKVPDIISCSTVCTNWNTISQDNLLWKYLFSRDFSKTNRKFHLKPGARSWKEEYIRLKEEYPCVKKQTLKGHTDEVLHAAFSHNGLEIASCSKDHQLIVWRRNENREFEHHFIVDMGHYDWRHTWAAQYSPLDTKLMVGGVVDEWSGEIAIFSTADYSLLCRLCNDPYDVMGCWCTDDYFLSGTMERHYYSFDASIWLCSPPTRKAMKKSSITNTLEEPNGEISSLPCNVEEKLETDIDCDSNMKTSSSQQEQNSINNLNPLSSDSLSQNESDKVLPRNDEHVVISWYKKQLLKFRNLQGNIYVRYIQNHSRKQFEPDPVDWEETRIRNRSRSTESDDDLYANPLDDPLQMRFDNFDDDMSFEIETGSEGMSEAEEKNLSEQEMCIIFICGNKTSVPHQVGFHRITSDGLNSTTNLAEPEKVIEMNGHVIGMNISPNKNYLYVNVRSWPENAVPSHDQPPPINQNIELRTIDLRTLEIQPQVLTGHKGYTPTDQAFYLYLDASKDFVASGSEDSNGYIWEKNYGILLTKLSHDECVNCVFFNPQDQQTCITASDDYTLQLWISKKHARLGS